VIRRPFERDRVRDAGTHGRLSCTSHSRLFAHHCRHLSRHSPASSAVIPAKAGIHEEQSGGLIAGSAVSSAFTRTWYGPVNLFGTRNGSET
jgi:hypothetical protein